MFFYFQMSRHSVHTASSMDVNCFFGLNTFFDGLLSFCLWLRFLLFVILGRFFNSISC